MRRLLWLLPICLVADIIYLVLGGAAPDCKDISFSDLRPLLGEEMSVEQFQSTIAAAVGLSAESISVRETESRGSEWWLYEWRVRYWRYDGSAKDGVLGRFWVTYSRQRPTVQRVIECLGPPVMYAADYELVPPTGDAALQLRLLYPSEGLYFSGVKYMRPWLEEPPGVEGSMSIYDVRIVRPASYEDILRGIYYTDDVADQMVRSFKPWPGSLDEIEVEMGPELAYVLQHR